MLVLFDHGTPKGLARALPGHTVHQQNLTKRRIALVVLVGSTSWSRVRQHVGRIAAAVDGAAPGSYAEIEIPFTPKPSRV